MKRRAYSLLVANAVVMVVLAIVCSRATGVPLRDPDGYIGPSWLRIPILLGGAFLLDIIPRTLWHAKGNPKLLWPTAVRLVRTHWTRERIKLVVIGLISFYAVYVSYRNLKNFLPFIRSLDDGRPLKYDNELHKLDLWFTGGHDPAVWADAIAGHLADAGLRARLAVGARQVAERFGWDAAAEQVLKVYALADAHRRA